MTIPLKTIETGRDSVLPDVSDSNIGAFERFARATSNAMGRPATFMVAVGLVLLWAAAGPVFHYSDTWQLAINTGTTVVTFLMVFLIQQSQNRDTLAVQVKLAELIIAMKGAHNALATAETLSEKELKELHAGYRKKTDETLAGRDSEPAMSVCDAVKLDAEAVNSGS